LGLGKLVGILHTRGISIRRGPEEHETVAGTELESLELADPSHRAVAEVEGRIAARDLFHESRDEFGTRAQDLLGPGMLREIPHHAADQGRRRFASCCKLRGGDGGRDSNQPASGCNPPETKGSGGLRLVSPSYPIPARGVGSR
jgi:hypothetical protein